MQQNCPHLTWTHYNLLIKRPCQHSFLPGLVDHFGATIEITQD